MKSSSKNAGILPCYVLFFLSGAAALIYEISWSRQIGLLFGHTVHAAAVVLASYFAGMAIGNVVGSRPSWSRAPLFAYGIAELLVAAWASLIPLLLDLSESPTVAAWLSSPSLAWQMAIRVVLCFLLLLPATSALGFTLPMMAEFLARERHRAMADSANAARVSLAYAVNTAGALVGVLSATYFLLLVVGVRTSSYVAAGISAACAVTACILARWHATQDEPEPRDAVSPLISRRSSGSARLWLALAGWSGFGTLALQVLYTRMFSLVFHNSTYTFGAVVAVFLASLAGGAALAGILQRRFHTKTLAGGAAGLGALATLLSVLVFVAVTDLEYFTFGDSFSEYLGGAFTLVLLIVAPPITLLGMLLPLSWKAAGGDSRAGNVVGRLTAINTVASAIGALAASFLLLPWIGLWQSFVLLALSFYVPGFLLLTRGGVRIPAYGGAVALGAISLVALYSPVQANDGRDQLGERLVRRWNSPYGWIDVVQTKKTGSFKVRQNLHYRFGETGQDAREYRQTHLPLLLHRRPRDVLFLGLGTGLTAGAAIPHREVDSVVAVELIPEVVQASRMLADHNYSVVDHPKVEIRVDDARHYLLATDRRFDAIISDLFVPWESESGYLYTAEHYQVARQRLKRGGLFCQWLPLYQLGKREFELIADTFASVFPRTTIWWGQMDASKPIVALVGTEDRIKVDAGRLETRLAANRRAADSTDETLHSPELFFNTYQGDWMPRHPDRLNTDEHPRVEFLTPISNRDEKMIRGIPLLEYYDEVLSQLPADAARLRFPDGGQPKKQQQRRAWQRFILFGQMNPHEDD